jgi:prolyl-tRNA synthetase
MRQSNHFGSTSKDDPKEARSVAHRYLLRAGYVRQAAPGIHVALPYFLRVLRNLGQIIRDQLDPQRFEEISLPLLQPKAYWEEPAMEDGAGQGVVFSFKDRRGNLLGIGGNGQRMLAALAAKEIRSHKDLPRRVFQIERQLADDAGGRIPLIHDRESLALDAFHLEADPAAAEAADAALRAALEAVCQQVGLTFRCAEADPAEEGVCRRQALMALVEGGDENLVICEACGYAATRQAGRSRLQVFAQDTESRPMEAVHGPGLIAVDPVAAFLGIPVWKVSKTLLFQASEQVVAVMVRGDCDVNEERVKQHLRCRELTLASPWVIRELTGAEVGYAGAVGLPPGVVVLADHFTRDRINFECGANRTDYHLVNVNWGRDLPLPTFGDFKVSSAGQLCPRCDQGRLQEARGVRVGELLRSAPCDSLSGPSSAQGPGGQSRTVFLGSARCNLTRLAAVVVEQHHDAVGIRWPAAVAPFQAHLIGLNLEDPGVGAEAERVYRELLGAGIDVLFDDRDARAGEKFSDADLLGIPIRLTISRRTLSEGKLELKRRGEPHGELVSQTEVLQAFTATR